MNRHDLGLPADALLLDDGLYHTIRSECATPILQEHVREWCEKTLQCGRWWTEWASVSSKGAGLADIIEQGGYAGHWLPPSSNMEAVEPMKLTLLVRVIMPVIRFEDERDMVAFRLRWAGE